MTTKPNRVPAVQPPLKVNDWVRHATNPRSMGRVYAFWNTPTGPVYDVTWRTGDSSVVTGRYRRDELVPAYRSFLVWERLGKVGGSIIGVSGFLVGLAVTAACFPVSALVGVPIAVLSVRGMAKAIRAARSSRGVA